MAALSLDDAKSFLRYEADDTDQDETITRALAAGQEWVEAYTGLLLTKREVSEPISALCGAPMLLSGPVGTGDGDTIIINYIGSDGGAASVGDARFIASDRYGRGSLWPAFNASWPVSDRSSAAMVTYQAGYADPDDAPQGLLEAMLVYAGMRDENRGAGDSEDQWRALWSIIAPYQRPGLA